MEILSSTQIDPIADDKLYEFQCDSCNTLVRATRGEAQSETENVTDYLLTYICPSCGQLIIHSLNKKAAGRVIREETHNLIV